MDSGDYWTYLYSVECKEAAAETPYAKSPISDDKYI